MTDLQYMERCDQLGAEAGRRGESPVGSIVVRNGQIIAEAGEANRAKGDITCHAEIEAIRLAVKKVGSNDLSDCVLYSTHEPCLMCAYAIRFHGFGKVVYRHPVPYLGGISSSMPLLTSTDVPPRWRPPPLLIRIN